MKRTNLKTIRIRPRLKIRASAFQFGWGMALWSALVLLLAGHVLAQAVGAPPEGLVVSAPGDEYRVLAEEISMETGYGLLDSPSEALKLNPVFLIWVISPATASDAQFVAYGQAVKDRRCQVSLGIITGGTLENARALWHRRRQASAHRLAALNGQSGRNFEFEGRILSWPVGQKTNCPLTLESMRRTLRDSDYVTFSGHGTPVSLVLNSATKFRAEDVPELPPLVVGTASCNTLRFWSDRSIALSFIDQGAAAYAGFVYSPNAGYLMGAFQDMPFRHTWPEFPIGHVLQALNQGCSRGFAAFPYYHLIGDPRMALSDHPCYQIVEDQEDRGIRRIIGRGAPAGVIPIRVSHGTAYPFIHIPGATSASDSDWFYNSRLQMADIGQDKYLLFLHGGGDFVIELHRTVSPAWALKDTLLDSLDHSFIFNSQPRADMTFLLVLGGVIMAWAGWRYRQGYRRAWITAALTGAVCSFLLAGYGWLRQAEVTVTSKPVTGNWMMLPGFFLLATAGGLVYLTARRWRGRIAGLLLACSFPLLSTIGAALILLILDVRVSRRLGSALWNYQLAWANGVALVMLLAFSFALLEGLRRMGQKGGS